MYKLYNLFGNDLNIHVVSLQAVYVMTEFNNPQRE